MKIEKSLLLILTVLTLLSFNCDWTQDAIEKKVQVDNQELAVNTSSTTVLGEYDLSTCDDLVVEIVTSREGMTSPKGHVLDIRVFKSSEFEFDDYVAGLENSAIMRKHSKLSKQQLNNLLRIIRSIRQVESESEYIGNFYCCDVFLKKAVTICLEGKRKSILIGEYDTKVHINRQNKLPDYTAELIRFVDELTSREFPSIVE